MEKEIINKKEKSIKEKPIQNENKILEDVLLPKSKHIVYEYEIPGSKEKITLEFDYSPPAIRNIIAISKQATDLALSFGIPPTELDKVDTPYKNEINIINIVSHLAYTVSNLKVNGQEKTPDYFLLIQDLNLLFELFRKVTES